MKDYEENLSLSNTNPTKNRGWAQHDQVLH